MAESSSLATEGPSSLLTALVLLLASLTLYLVYCLYHRAPAHRAQRPLARRPDAPTTAHCASPDCVRCQRYDCVRVEARLKLRAFSSFNGAEGLERVSAGVCDDRSLLPSPGEGKQAPSVHYVPGLRARPWWGEGGEFSRDLRRLERQWVEVGEEGAAVYGGKDARWTRNSTEGGEGMWAVYRLYDQGVRQTDHCRACPLTAALVESLSSFMRSSLFGNAFFSVLLPGTSLTPHCGPTNARLRCHLGLVVPPNTVLTVGGEARAWRPGCCLLFDDSFSHSARHEGDATSDSRVVLVIDLWHPDLSVKERHALTDIFPAGQQ